MPSVEKYENNKGDRQLHLPPSVNNEASTRAFNKTLTRRSNHLHGVSPLKVGSLSCIDMELLAKHRHGASTKHLCRALANLKTGFSPSMQVLFTPCYERSAVVSALRRCPPRSAPRCPWGRHRGPRRCRHPCPRRRQWPHAPWRWPGRCGCRNACRPGEWPRAGR